MDELVLISPCSGPVRRAAPAGVEAIVFSLAQGLRDRFPVRVVATPDSELPGGVVHHPCDLGGLGEAAGRLAASMPSATFCDHSGASIDERDHPRFFRVFHVEPRYVFTPDPPGRCAFVSSYLRSLFAAQRDPRFASCPVLFNGVDPSPGLAGGQAPAGPGVDLRGVIYLGRLNRLKGIDLGAAACASLGLPLFIHGGLGKETPPDVVFNDLALLDELPRPGAASPVYRGPLRDPSLKRAVLAGAAAVLIPSREAESCSLVALEAVAAGTPVVSFRRGGVAEYLGDHPGVFFAPYTGEDRADIDALASALRAALEAPRPAPGLPARFTEAAMVERYLGWLAPGAQPAPG